MRQTKRGNRLRIFAAAILLTTGVPVTARSSIDALVGAPYAETLAHAERDPRIAWTVVEKGVANIWTARAPDFAPKALTAFKEDDGQPIGQLALAPDGRYLAFAKGIPGGANPASLVAPPEAGVWLLDITTGRQRPLGPGFDPKFAPDGKRLIFRRQGRLFATGVDAGSEARPLFSARGAIGSYRWSPDGSSLAFVSQRQTHSFIGVYRPGAKNITWLAPSAANDLSPSWSSDGKRVAFLRMPTKDRTAPRSVLDGLPLSVWTADPTSGQGREIWRAPGEDGGYPQETAGDDALRWMADGSLLLYSEHEGWSRLYRLSVDGTKVTALTPGECETSESVIAADDAILFSSNCGDLDRRHIWRVGIEGRGLRQLTKGDSIDSAPLALAGGRYIAYRSGTSRQPQQIVVRDIGSGTSRALRPTRLPNGFDTPALVEPVPVSFTATDGRPVRGQLFLPNNAKGRRPAIVFVHGGPFFQTYLGWHDIGVFGMSYAFNQYLAQQGYAVLSVNFRTSTGYGRDFRRAPEAGPLGASEYRDVLGAARYLQSRADVDPERIGIWGGSYGGFLTALALAKNSDVFKAGVDLSGFHDWNYRWAQGVPPAEGFGVGPDEEAIAHESSPVAHLDNWKSPVFVVASDDDRIVPIEETTDIVERLRKRGVPVEAWIAPDEQHIFATHSKTVEKLERIADFFDRHLGTRGH